MSAAEAVAALPDEARVYVPGVGEVTLGEIRGASVRYVTTDEAARRFSYRPETWARWAAERKRHPWSQAKAAQALAARLWGRVVPSTRLRCPTAHHLDRLQMRGPSSPARGGEASNMGLHGRERGKRHIRSRYAPGNRPSIPVEVHVGPLPAFGHICGTWEPVARPCATHGHPNWPHAGERTTEKDGGGQGLSRGAARAGRTEHAGQRPVGARPPDGRLHGARAPGRPATHAYPAAARGLRALHGPHLLGLHVGLLALARARLHGEPPTLAESGAAGVDRRGGRAGARCGRRPAGSDRLRPLHGAPVRGDFRARLVRRGPSDVDGARAEATGRWAAQVTAGPHGGDPARLDARGAHRSGRREGEAATADHGAQAGRATRDGGRLALVPAHLRAAVSGGEAGHAALAGEPRARVRHHDGAVLQLAAARSCGGARAGGDPREIVEREVAVDVPPTPRKPNSGATFVANTGRRGVVPIPVPAPSSASSPAYVGVAPGVDVAALVAPLRGSL